MEDAEEVVKVSRCFSSFDQLKTYFEENKKNDTQVRVTVHGQFVRKRKLSKTLVFGDIKLKDGVLLEVMIRAKENILSIDDIKKINWDVHLGDMVTSVGLLEHKSEKAFLFVLETIQVDELWSTKHSGFFDPTIHTMIISKNQQVSTHFCSSSGKLESKVDARHYTNIVTLDGQNACKYYFAQGKASCLRGEQCHFWHGKKEEYEKNRKEWLAKRLAQKRQVATIEGDLSDPHSKLMKTQRARIFAEWLIQTFGEETMKKGSGVIDIAGGGKGEIPIELWTKREIKTTLIDPRPMKMSKKNHQLISKCQHRSLSKQILSFLNEETIQEHHKLFSDCSLLVGMHPDEATEIIIDTALKFNKPFAVVPCCVMSRLFSSRFTQKGQQVENYQAFIIYLMEKHSKIQKTFLPFTGKNQVLYYFGDLHFKNSIS